MEIPFEDPLTIIDPLKIISSLLIPIIITIATLFINKFFKTSSILNEKNKYIKYLKANFSPIKKFIDTVKNYRRTVCGMSFPYFFAGIIVGFVIEVILGWIIPNIFDYILHINYIGKLFNLSSDVFYLNVIAIIYSLLNIGIIISVILFFKWLKFLKSNKFLIPKIDEYGTIEPSSFIVYPSFWIFIGMVFGLYLTIILYFIGTLSQLSIIGDNHSFDRMEYDFAYAHLLHPEVHFIVYMFGFLISFFFILRLYVNAKQFKEAVISSITDFYKYDFPYVKIKTESGELNGQLRDILDKRLVTLSDNNILKIVQWDKIETMEISPKNKKEICIFNDPFTK